MTKQEALAAAASSLARAADASGPGPTSHDIESVLQTVRRWLNLRNYENPTVATIRAMHDVIRVSDGQKHPGHD